MAFGGSAHQPFPDNSSGLVKRDTLADLICYGQHNCNPCLFQVGREPTCRWTRGLHIRIKGVQRAHKNQ